MIKSSAYGLLAADLEINKAMVFLHNRETQLAIDTLKVFENRESNANSAASTMLSFIYFLVNNRPKFFAIWYTIFPKLCYIYRTDNLRPRLKEFLCSFTWIIDLSYDAKIPYL